MGTFDPESFLTNTTTEESSTKRIPLEAGEYVGQITKLRAGTTPNKGIPFLEVIYKIEHPELASEMGRPASTVRQTVWLDLDEHGDLDMGPGKNITLGRLRDAAGQNVSGEPWSIASLEGATVTVRVVHNPDKNDPEVVYEEVKGVSAL